MRSLPSIGPQKDLGFCLNDIRCYWRFRAQRWHVLTGVERVTLAAVLGEDGSKSGWTHGDQGGESVEIWARVIVGGPERQNGGVRHNWILIIVF